MAVPGSTVVDHLLVYPRLGVRIKPLLLERKRERESERERDRNDKKSIKLGFHLVMHFHTSLIFVIGAEDCPTGAPYSSFLTQNSCKN